MTKVLSTAFDSVNGEKASYSTLADGTIIPRAYPDPTLEEKRIMAINVMGKKWILHPANAVLRSDEDMSAMYVALNRTQYFLTEYFDNLRMKRMANG